MKYVINANKLLEKLLLLEDDAARGKFIRDAALLMVGHKLKCYWAEALDEPQKKNRRFTGYTEDFEEFWRCYPSRRRTGKGKAFQSWNKAKESTEDLLAKCKLALAWQKKQDQWLKDHGLYIPMPTTYLNQRRWEDERPEETGGYHDINGVYHPD